MQNQQKFDSMSNMSGETLAPPNEYQSNIHTREQTPTQEYTSRSYEEGHEQGYEQAGLDERDFWPRDSEKLRPEPKNQKGMGGLLALIVLLCAGFIAGSFFGVILSWLTWGVVIVLIVAGLAARVSKDNGGTTGVQVDLALEMLGLDAPTACFHRDLPLKIVRVYAAATSAHANHPTSALKRDSSRAILQLYIATGRHSDLEIDSAQTKLENAPGHAA